MSSLTETSKRYSYSFHSSTSANPDAGAISAAARENLLSIKQSLLLLTGGCEISEHQDGYYCDKHGRKVARRDSRCDYVAEQFSSSTAREQSRAQIQRYVNDILGVKDPALVRRLTGS